MKTVKRIAAVALLIITALVVGYLVYTSSRTASAEEIATVWAAAYEQTASI